MTFHGGQARVLVDAPVKPPGNSSNRPLFRMSTGFVASEVVDSDFLRRGTPPGTADARVRPMQAPVFVVWAYLNTVAWGMGTTVALPFGTICALLVMYTLVCGTGLGSGLCGGARDAPGVVQWVVGPGCVHREWPRGALRASHLRGAGRVHAQRNSRAGDCECRYNAAEHCGGAQ